MYLIPIGQESQLNFCLITLYGSHKCMVFHKANKNKGLLTKFLHSCLGLMEYSYPAALCIFAYELICVQCL